jgi:hypothetical protein
VNPVCVFSGKKIKKEITMAIINNITEVLHRIRVKLYTNYLPNVEGQYISSLYQIRSSFPVKPP